MFYNPDIDELNLADIDSDIKRKYFEEVDSTSFINKEDFKDYVHKVLNQPQYLEVFQTFGKYKYNLRSDVKVGKEVSQFYIEFNYHEAKTQVYSAFGFNKSDRTIRFLYTSCDILNLNSTLTSDLLDLIFQKALLK